MPTYEYECRTNGHRFEVKQSFSDPAIEACEVCGEPVRKIFSAAGIVFKGSGYYVTDTRKKAASGAKAEGAGKDAGGSKDGGRKDGGGNEGAAATTSDTPSATPAKKDSAAPAAASGSA